MNTPRTDKFYDEVSDRESPDNGQKGWSLPSKWSYEAIIDLVDFARKLEVENAELQRKIAVIVEWLDKNRADVWASGLWDALDLAYGTKPLDQAINAELLKALKPIAEAYSDDPGTSDLYDDQPVSITLGMVRKARAAIKKAT